MSEALRILLVAHGLPPESVGGVEQHVEGLARALHARGHAVTIWCRTGRADVAQGSVHEDPRERWPFRVVRVAYRHEGLHDLHSLYAVPALDAALTAFLATERFDVAHVHHLTGVSTGALGVLRARGARTVLTLHDYWLLCPRGQMWHRRGERCDAVEVARCTECLTPTFGAWLPAGVDTAAVARLHAEARTLLRDVDALVVPSARALPPFVANGLEAARVHVVANGVDTPGLLRLAPPRRRPGRPLRVGYLGTVIPSKGLDVLVAALSLLPPGTVELAVHGNAVPYHGDEGFLTRVFSRLRPGDKVVYHGPYRGDEVANILAELEVVVAPALWHEAFGLTVREALAAARPVVVARVGGLQDAITDGLEGVVVPPGDPAALARALARLATDAAFFAGAVAATRNRTRGFGPMTDELVSLYRSSLRA